MLYSAWNHQGFPWPELNDAVAEFDSKTAFPHQKEFIFMVMMVPRKLALKLDEFHLLTIQAGNYFGPPVI
jgi:hypothetical protein